MIVVSSSTRGEAAALMEADNFEAWKEGMSNRFVRLHVSTSQPENFHGRVVGRRFDTVNLSRVSASIHQVDRLDKDICIKETRYYKLSLILAGSGLVMQNGRHAALGPGDMALYDTGQPYSAMFSDNADSVVMVFPREALNIPRADVDKLLARALKPVGPGMVRVASSFLEQVGTDLGSIAGHSGILLAHNALDIVNTLIYSELGLDKSGSSHEINVATIKEYIDQRLSDSDLCPRTIAEAHFMSTRSLQYLFEETGTTVASLIRRRRLECVRRDLLDPSLKDLTLLQIASRWGFSDAPHFSRTFKAEYGATPSSYRRGAEESL